MNVAHSQLRIHGMSNLASISRLVFNASPMSTSAREVRRIRIFAELRTECSKDHKNSGPHALHTTLIQSINDHHDISSRRTSQLGKGFENEFFLLCCDVFHVPQ